MPVFNGTTRVGRKPVLLRNNFKLGALYQSDHANRAAMSVGGHELLPGQNVVLHGDVVAMASAKGQILRWVGQEAEDGNR